jgi:hypothetical protein
MIIFSGSVIENCGACERSEPSCSISFESDFGGLSASVMVAFEGPVIRNEKAKMQEIVLNAIECIIFILKNPPDF